jgi:hypothetical protein
VANLILPSRFTQQPQYPVELNPEFPRPVFIYNPATRLETISKTSGVLTGGAIVPSSDGFGLQFNNVADQGLSFGTQQLISGTNYTFLVLANAQARASQRNVVFNQRGAGPYVGCSFNTAYDLSLIEAGSFSLTHAVVGEAGARLQNVITNTVSAYAMTRGVTVYTGSVNGRTVVPAVGGTDTNSAPSGEVMLGDLGTFTGTGYGSQDPIYLVIAWNSVIPQATLNKLTDNPWQIFKKRSRILYFDVAGGATIVSTTQAGSWSVRNTVSTTQAAAFSVRNLVATTQPAAWSVRNAVATDQAGAWSVYNLASQTQAGAWTVRNLVATTQAGAWSVEQEAGIVSVTQDGAWSVRNLVSTSQSGAWSVRNLATTTQSGAWTVRGLASTSQAGSWSVFGFADAYQDGAWSIEGITLATATQPGAWSVRNWVSASQAGAWTVGDEASPVSAGGGGWPFQVPYLKSELEKLEKKSAKRKAEKTKPPKPVRDSLLEAIAQTLPEPAKEQEPIAVIKPIEVAKPAPIAAPQPAVQDLSADIAQLAKSVQAMQAQIMELTQATISMQLQLQQGLEDIEALTLIGATMGDL